MPDFYIADELMLEEVSHVDSPANKHATVVLWKRANPNPGAQVMPQTIEELTKSVTDLNTQTATLTKNLNDSTALVATLKAVLLADGYEIDGDKITKADESKFIVLAGERILKSSVPAAVLKSLEASQTAIESLTKAAEVETLHKRADLLVKNFVGTIDTRAALIKAVDGIADSVTRDAVVATLKGADAALVRLTKELGSTEVDEASPTAQLNKMAKDRATKDNTTFEVAYVEVIKTREGAALAAKVSN